MCSIRTVCCSFTTSEQVEIATPKSVFRTSRYKVLHQRYIDAMCELEKKKKKRAGTNVQLVLAKAHKIHVR